MVVLNFLIKFENLLYDEIFRLPQYDDMAFNLPRGQALLDKWNEIPAGIDVLITHTPPLGCFSLMIERF